MKKTIFLFLASILVLQSCSKDDETTVTPTPTPNAVRLSDNATHGKILTDSEGKSLYFFSNDSKGIATCTTGTCADTWPVFYKETITLDAGLNAADFATITVGTRKQTTYKGYPLYYFVNDNAAGQTNGDKVNNVWYVAKPDYSLMYSHAQLIGKDASGNPVNYKSDYTPGNELTFYMTDNKGRTLYTFSNDKKDKNNFTNATFSNNSVWPVFNVALDKLPSILNPADFGTITINGTQQQMTYKGWPLYYYGQDLLRGDNFGINFPIPGKWPVPNANTALAPIN
jgi:predicted lipoprotein with Yx(FWY)xxD motif